MCDKDNPLSSMENILHVLIIDDDQRLRILLKRYLSENGFRVSGACSAKEARNLLDFIKPDALILDISMPGEDGLELTNFLRENGNDLLIILLTARGDPEDRIIGLEAGADDYLGKPFEPKELLLRLKSHFRKKSNVSKELKLSPIRLGSMEFDPVLNVLKTKTGLVHLTSGEIDLLRIFASHPNTILSREKIMKQIGLEEIGERAVDVQVTRLRKRIEIDPKCPKYLHTVRGKGYILKPYF
ncbi:Transcriptional regulatory protein OmpR [Commensalibacter sp. Nvir]|uniref:response regulator n=1 Tax=Commensalibacter sp. Nvir TaxID=3069817 RepID=UPI002D68F241|nr:Transcriptional regulatory protein OmpR [Commensalibacter sp. Nvir]